MRSAQTQAITLVLISGIVISLVGFAYAWGKPIIDKRSVITQFASTIRFMEDLDRKIVDMAGTCSFEGACEETLELPAPGIIMLLDDPENTIIYKFQVNQPLVTKGEVLFNTADNGTFTRYGGTPGVISLKGERLSAASYELTFSLRYRELISDEPWKSYIIDLVQSGLESGNKRISISYGGSETQTGGGVGGRDKVVSKIKVQTT